MSILIKSATILEPGSPYHKQKKNILISDSGILKYIGKEAPSAKKTVESKDLHVSIGWLDMRANFNDPGLEYKEDLASGLMAAASGGFTGVSLLPNTEPCIESKNDVSYLLSKNSTHACKVYPLGAITKSCKGEDFTEILDMHAAGAVAFTDGENPIWNTDILLKSLLYLQKIDGLLINKAEDKYLTAFGTMNEGNTSTILGLKGMPGIAEEIMIKRDLELLKYAGGKLHFSNVSTLEALKEITKAKKSGLQVSCDIASYSLLYDDSALADYDTNFKVNPPLRDKKDVKALYKGLLKDEVDVIVSSHTPQDEESKKLEFDLADFGMIGLQTFYPMLLEALGEEFYETLDKFTCNPRQILGIPTPSISEGSPAEMTLFDPTIEWTFDQTSNYSKSINSPLFGKKLKGGIVGVINKERSHFNSLA